MQDRNSKTERDQLRNIYDIGAIFKGTFSDLDKAIYKIVEDKVNSFTKSISESFNKFNNILSSIIINDKPLLEN